MIILAGKKINENEPLFYSLTNIYGIGYSQSWEICKSLGLSKNVTFSFLSLKKKKKLTKLIEKLFVGSLRFNDKIGNIKHLQNINLYRGWRHKKKLPVRGQRTKTNRRTRQKGIF